MASLFPHEPARPPEGRIPEAEGRRFVNEPARPPEGRIPEAEGRRFVNEPARPPEGRRSLNEPLCNPLQPQGFETLSPPGLPTATEDDQPHPADPLDRGEEFLAGVLMQALHILVGGEFEDRPRVLAAVKAALVLQRQQGPSTDTRAWVGIWDAAPGSPIDTVHGPFGEIVDTRF
jgi:hypothetical protein